MHTTDPLVSICIPVLNGAEFIERALDSALAQSYEPLEIIVADDHSSDGTAELVRQRYGQEVRLHANRQRTGLCGNHNVAIRYARGEFIKFLHHDDTLEPECVAKMADALNRHRRAGLVFAPRALETVQDEADEARQDYADVHTRFSGLEPINDGRALVTEWLAKGFPDNWIGEPVAVMVTREGLARAGLFSPHVRQLMDIDLWMRILAAGLDAAFIDERLATYRQSSESSTGRTVTRHAHWLDPLWMLEHLISVDGVATQHPMLADMVGRHRRIAFRSAARSALPHGQRYPVWPYWSYLRYRTRRALLQAVGSDGGPRLPRLEANMRGLA
jgi:glycosyltransferase involved in cell wall biosynthesis